VDPILSPLSEQEFEQESPAHFVDRDNAIPDAALLAGRAIARGTDLHANNTPPKGVEQRFAIGGVIGEIGDDHTQSRLYF
jgi:hypothetical protein